MKARGQAPAIARETKHSDILIAGPAVRLLGGSYVPNMNTPPPDRQLLSVEGKAQFPNFCGRYWLRIALVTSGQVPNAQLPRTTPKGRQFAARGHGPCGRVRPRQGISLAFTKPQSVPKAERAVGEHG